MKQKTDSRRLLIVFLIFLSVAAPVCLQASDVLDILERVEIPSSFNPVGSGARALGMGGAFIAVADDATAASWNPGGLIQLESPEISFVGTAFHRIEDNSFGAYPPANGDQTVSAAHLNYLSAVYPFVLFDRNMVASVNYQRLYDMTRQWTLPLEIDIPEFYIRQMIDSRQKGGLSALGLAWCIQASPRLSFGLTLNIWNDGLTKNGWEQTTVQRGTGIDQNGSFTFRSRISDRYSFSGINVNMGMLWDITGKLTFGAVIKTPFKADLEHEFEFSSSLDYPDQSSSFSVRSKTDDTLTMPISFGVGLAYRFSDAWTISADLYRTQWDDFELESEGVRKSPLTGSPSGEVDISPTHQVRIGSEYVFIISDYIVPVRGGIFYDPAPSEGSDDDVYGFSIGAGVGYKRFFFDMAYQYRSGNSVGASVLKEWDFSQDVTEHTVYASMIIHF